MKFVNLMKQKNHPGQDGFFCGAGGGIRTHDLLITNQLL